MLDDRPYYNTFVLPIQNWFLTYNARAMILISEAYHFQAWIAAGQPKSSSADDIIPNVCPSGTKSFDCLQPSTIYTNQFLPFTQAEFAAGGAPYSTNDFVLQIGQDYLLATSIENYNEANGDSCLSPLTSADPCGVTVGKYNDSFTSIQYGPYNYGDGNGTWNTAPEFLFNNLFNLGGWNGSKDGSLASDYLCTMSLSGGDVSTCTQDNNGSSGNGGQGLSVGKKIIQFNKTQPFSPCDVICFFDGNIAAGFTDESFLNGITPMPFCQEDSGDRFFALINNIITCGDKITPDVGNETTGSLANGEEGSTASWYKNYCQCFPDGCNSLSQWFTCENTQEQFRWPALKWTELTCSGSDSGMTPADAKNPAGVQTLCGTDFDVYFNNLVPPNDT